MKLAMWHKTYGILGTPDEVMLNMPIFPADYTYASVLFDWNKNKFIADEYGGPAYENSKLPEHIEALAPGYFLYERLRRGGLGYSLGYTYRPCHRDCDFCKVNKFSHPDEEHHSIWEFHDSKHSEICLLNNNTFMDRRWKETFEEIWDADLTVRDENGYDLRLLDDEKADALQRTKFSTPIHFAWDRMQDEKLIVDGLRLLGKHNLRTTSNGVYVLIGFDTNEAEDLHRCQVISDFGFRPYIMPFNQTKQEKRFKRFIDTFMWRKYKTIAEAWNNYVR